MFLDKALHCDIAVKLFVNLLSSLGSYLRNKPRQARQCSAPISDDLKWSFKVTCNKCDKLLNISNMKTLLLKASFHDGRTGHH